MGKIENVIFDLGNVLLKYRPCEYLKTLFSDANLVGQLYQVVFAGPEWSMLDRGVIAQKEAIDRLQNQYPHLATEIEAVFADWFSLLTPIPDTVEVLQI